MDKAADAFRTISEVAEDLDVPQHVLRFWETRFAHIKPMKRGGGRRYYRPDDVDLLRGIRHLLYGEGYTIRGVQRILKDSGVKFVQSVWRSGAPQPPPPLAEDDEGRSGLTAGPALPPDEDGDLEPAVEAARPPPPSAAPTRAIGTLPPSWPQGEQTDAAPVPGRMADERARPNAEGSPAAAALTGVRAEAASSAASMSREDIAKLQAALATLGECRRLLDAALKDDE